MFKIRVLARRYADGDGKIKTGHDVELEMSAEPEAKRRFANRPSLGHGPVQARQRLGKTGRGLWWGRAIDTDA